MIAYHLDRCQTLKANSEIHLLNTHADPLNATVKLYGFDMVSHWGKQIYDFHLNRVVSLEHLNSFQIDLTAETIRQSFFPDAPSRLKSLFAVRKLSDFKLWKKHLPISPESHIYEVEFDSSKYIELDASFLKGGVGYNPFIMNAALMKYWSGQKSNSPLPELLIPLPVFIGRRITPSEIIL